MTVLYLILYVLAVVCFVGAAFEVRARINLIALGLAFAFAIPLIQTIHKL